MCALAQTQDSRNAVRPPLSEVALLSLGVLISAAYSVRTIGRLFTGPVRVNMRHVPDLTRTELAAASVLSAGILGIGFFPAPTLNLMTASINHLSRLF